MVEELCEDEHYHSVTMRKRSKYKPRGVIYDTMTFVTKGISRLVENTEDDLKIRIRSKLGFQKISDGNGTMKDLDSLVAAANMTTALSRTHGSDWKVEIRAGVDAIEAIQLRLAKWGKVQATPAELTAIKLLRDIHDAQLDAATVIDLEKALVIAQKGESKVTRIVGVASVPT